MICYYFSKNREIFVYIIHYTCLSGSIIYIIVKMFTSGEGEKGEWNRQKKKIGSLCNCNYKTKLCCGKKKCLNVKSQSKGNKVYLFLEKGAKKNYFKSLLK